MQRREFLKNTAAIAGAAAVGGRAPSSMATTPKDTLLVLVENGPNSLDIHGVGTTFRSYVACWNLYDRLLTFGHKTLPDGGLSYDYTKIEPELAEEFIALATSPKVQADGIVKRFNWYPGIDAAAVRPQLDEATWQKLFVDVTPEDLASKGKPFPIAPYFNDIRESYERKVQ